MRIGNLLLRARTMDILKLKVKELREELARRGLDTKGRKAELQERLKRAVEAEAEPDIDVSRLTVKELKAELKKRGLSTSGRKAVLQKRLQNALDGALPEDSESEDEERDVSSKSLREMLRDIGIDDPEDEFAGANSISEEFKVVKKRYFKLVLREHPDKGGDVVKFRRGQTSFEVLRDMYEKGNISSFADDDMTAASGTYARAWRRSGGPTPSWEFYAEAAESPDPLYRVERARSNRSKCVQKGKAQKKCLDGCELIPKGELRVGSMNPDSGSYGWWNHLACWRVPSKVWTGIEGLESPKDVEGALFSMNEVLFCGLDELNVEESRCCASCDG